jgi:hypothetical protein
MCSGARAPPFLTSPGPAQRSCNFKVSAPRAWAMMGILNLEVGEAF